MNHSFSFSQFLSQFSDDDSCLEEIRKIRYPNGVYCVRCKTKTIHYKITGRTAYSCKLCRNQVYPLSGTIFEKTTTPLRLWFIAMFLMTHSRGNISVKQLQRELGVTYKTAWRMYTQIHMLMAQNNGDLLVDATENVRRWVLFNKIEITVPEARVVVTLLNNVL